MIFITLVFLLGIYIFKNNSNITVKASAVPACYNPVDYGAIALEDSPDFNSTPGFMAALAAIPSSGGVLCVPAGSFRLVRQPIGSYDRFAGLSTHACHISIKGENEHSTILKMYGDQANGDTFVISLDPGACDIRISDLTIDTSGMINTSEQTHAIAIGTGVCSAANGTCSLPVADTAIERVRFIHPKTPGVRKGDCIRLLGNLATTPVVRTKIIGSTFSNCARSSIGVQRNVNSLKVIGNHFSAPSVDQQFDGEATGGDWDDGLELIGNTFDDDLTQSQGDYAVALTSQRHAIVQGNIFNGRGLVLYRTSDVVVSGNIINQTARAGVGGGTIESGNIADRLVISGNIITRQGVGGVGVRIMPHSGGLPTGVSIQNNTIKNETDGTGILIQSGQDLTISNNSLDFPNSTANTNGIFLFSQARIGDGIIISGNRITGALYAGVRLNGSAFGFGDLTLVGNQVQGSNRGLNCDNNPLIQPIVSVGNKWGTVACSATTTIGQ